MYNFEALTDDDRAQMLDIIGVKTIDEIFDNIPNKARMASLDLS